MVHQACLSLIVLLPLVAADAPMKRGEFSGHYYEVVDFEPGTLSWQQALEASAARGGYLACIETAEEQEFLARLLGEDRYAFLGASDAQQEGEFRWVNGSPFTYTYWRIGQPNNYRGEEHYLATYDRGEWVDVAAQGDDYWMPSAYIIEWEQPPKW